MNTKSLILILVFLFVSSINLFSQSDFRKGYIITLQNDTVYGLINYKSSTSNLSKCYFKKDSLTNENIYTPLQIKSYRFIDGKYYISKNIIIDNVNTDVFLEYLIKGKANIYFYGELLNPRYFIEMDDNKLIELKNTKILALESGLKYTAGSKEYIGVLKFLFKQSNEVSEESNNVVLDHKSLINIAKKYHNKICSNEECIVFEKKDSKVRRLTGIYGEIYKRNHFTINENLATYKSNLGFSLGYFYRKNFPDFNEKLYIQYEGAFSTWSAENNITSVNIYNNVYSSNYKFSQFSININFLVRKEFFEGKVKPVFFGGFYLSYNYKSNLEIEEVTSFYWGYIEKKNIKYSESSIDFGPLLGIGLVTKIRKRDINFDFRFKLRSVTQYSVSIFSLHFSIQLNK